MDASTTRRPNEEVNSTCIYWADIRDDLAKRTPPAEAAAYPSGIVAALRWLLGEAERSPILGRMGLDLTNPEEVDRERRAATRMLQGEEQMDQRGQAYVSGVETALMWAYGLSDASL